MMWIVLAVAIGVLVLAHTAPAPFVLEMMAGDRAVWHMARDSPPTIYFTYDDGPNPTTTPDLLDVLARGGVHATFFLIDRHLTEETAPIVKRMFAEDHAVALHSAYKSDMFKSPAELARTLEEAASRIEDLAGSSPCRAFRPRGGWRSRAMYEGLREIDFRLVGWGWMLWDVDLFHPRTADRTVARIISRARGGDIIVMHDGDESAPRKDQRATVEATARLIHEFRRKRFEFGTVCDNGG